MKITKNKYLLTSLLALLFMNSDAQQLFSAEQAAARAMEVNYSVRIARIDASVAENNASAGNAGMLPAVDAEAAYTSSINSIDQKYSNGNEINTSNAKQTLASVGVRLEWTLFDGMKMFASYDRLKTLSEQGRLDLKIRMENTLNEVLTAYYSLVKEVQQKKAMLETYSFYQERLNISERKYMAGSSSKLDYLQSRVDLNERQAAMLEQDEKILQARTALNYLLVFPVDSMINPEDTIIFSHSPDYTNLKNSLPGNFQYRRTEQSIGLRQLELKELKGSRYPTLTGNAGYLFSDNRNDAGFFLKNQNTSLQFGITARYNLFNGFNSSRQIKNAGLHLQSAQISFEDIRQQLSSELILAFEHFKNSESRMKLEEENIIYARENVSVVTESYKLGSANVLQVNQAQESLNDALTRMVSTRLETKLAEINLMKLTGQLIK